MSVSVLINGVASVSSESWAIHLLAAAVLANEKIGAIVLRPNLGASDISVLPGDTAGEWGADTLEARLRLQTGGRLSDLGIYS